MTHFRKPHKKKTHNLPHFVVQTINKVLDDFERDQDILIGSEAERNRMRFQELISRLKEWERSRTCVFRGCTKLSVPRSHTIQRSGPLFAISEEGHVLAPRFDHKTEKLSMARVGLNEASTFPGFCEQHEGIFAEFERAHDFSDPRHFQLQIYRTICRELVIKRAMLVSLEKMKANYLIFRQNKLFSMIEAKLGSSFMKKQNLRLQSIKFNNIDIREAVLDKEITKAKTDIDAFESQFYEAISQDIEENSFSRLTALVFDLDVQIPVSLAGRGNFFIKKNDTMTNVNVVLNVLPYEDHTYTIIASPSNHDKMVQAYQDAYSKHALVFLTMIESWMVHGSDHWFIKPSVWNHIAKSKQRQILDDIFDFQYNIGHPCSHSIFNDLRQEFIHKMASVDENKLNPSFAEFIDQEREKLRASHSANGS
jgi:hypothetical protein